MTWLHSIFILAVAFVAVFLEAACDLPRHLFGTQIDLLPALMVYTALTNGIATIALLAVCGGLWFDSLSLNPLGASVLPLAGNWRGHFHRSRDLLMRENISLRRRFWERRRRRFNRWRRCSFFSIWALRRCWAGFRSGNGW